VEKIDFLAGHKVVPLSCASLLYRLCLVSNVPPDAVPGGNGTKSENACRHANQENRLMITGVFHFITSLS
jgi:hypothetical protein